MSQNPSIQKNGDLVMNTGHTKFIVPNFTETNSMDGWTFTGSPTIQNGIVTLTGTSPNIYSPIFNVGENDIICVEMTVALPVPSTTTGGPGLYMGTTLGQASYQHVFNFTTQTWTQGTSTTTNPYFFYSYNSQTPYMIKSYIMGPSANIADLPYAEATNTSITLRAIQMASGQTTIRLRHGYNTNTTMTISLANFKIYNITQRGFSDFSATLTAKIGKNWANANEFIEL